MIVKLKRKRINIDVKKLSFFGKFTGLMFRSRNTENLLFDFSNSREKAIHSFFVFFPFLALWLDDKNNIVEYNLVKPFTFLVKPKKDVSQLIEVPANDKNKEIIEIVDGKGKI